jgi:hypothetical protein
MPTELDDVSRRRLFDELCSRDWGFHGWAADVSLNWALTKPPLELIVERVRDGDRTLETGAGYSTIAFALMGAEHTAVSPFALEHERIVAWCDERGVPTDRLTFVAERSQDALGRLGDAPLDFALVDGDHAFPIPFIDFYYAAVRLRPGGVLLVDDTHIKTGAILRDFLGSEKGRWRPLRQFASAVAFERGEGDLVDAGGWLTQPYCANPGWVTPRLSEVPGRVRGALRVRTRLRQLLDRRRA